MRHVHEHVSNGGRVCYQMPQASWILDPVHSRIHSRRTPLMARNLCGSVSAMAARTPYTSLYITCSRECVWNGTNNTPVLHPVNGHEAFRRSGSLCRHGRRVVLNPSPSPKVPICVPKSRFGHVGVARNLNRHLAHNRHQTTRDSDETSPQTTTSSHWPY